MGQSVCLVTWKAQVIALFLYSVVAMLIPVYFANRISVVENQFWAILALIEI